MWTTFITSAVDFSWIPLRKIRLEYVSASRRKIWYIVAIVKPLGEILGGYP
jgi:hypothetical protein